MDWNAVPLTAPLLLVATITFLVAYFSWRHREVPGAIALIWLALSVSVWSLTYALERNAVGLPAKLLWSRLQYIGIVSVPVAWLVFSARYAARSSWFTPRRLTVVLLVPLLTLLLVFTNEAHGLIWRRVTPVSVGSTVALDLRYAPWFWVHATYSYLAMLLGSVLLIRLALYSRTRFRFQAMLLLIGALAPWAGNALFVFRLGYPGPLDLTPFAFGLSTFIFAAVLFRYQLLALVPIAHDAIIAAMRDGVFVLDDQGHVVDLNPTAEQLIGRPRAAARGQPIAHLLRTQRSLVELWTGASEAHIDLTLHQGRELRSFDAHVSSLYGFGGHMSGRLVILRDISERKRAQETQSFLAEASGQLSASLDFETTLATVTRLVVPALADWCALHLIGDDGAVRRVALTCGEPIEAPLAEELLDRYLFNPAAPQPRRATLYGGRSELIATRPSLWPPGRPDTARYSEIAEALRLHSIMYVPISARGRTFGVLTLAAAGERLGYMPADQALAEELARRAALALDNARLVADLRASKEAAATATHAKSEFLAHMSHEIRTPISGVIGAADLLRKTSLDGEQLTLVEMIRTSGRALLTVINDTLDFSKIESGKLDLRHEPFDLRACLEEALDLVALRADEKGLDLAYAINPRTPELLVGDGARVRQILLNLLSNAVKFTDAGSVFTWVSAISIEGPRYEITVAVQDTGIGIPRAKLGQLFQSFSQLDLATTRQRGGSGLGLALSKRLSEMMGGRMWVESLPGRGSTFYCTIQVEARAEPPGELQQPVPELAGKQVLVVDVPGNRRRTLVVQLEAWGMLAREAPSAEEALALIERGVRVECALVVRRGGASASTLAALLDSPPLTSRSTPAPVVLILPLRPSPTEPRLATGQAYVALTSPVKAAQLRGVLLSQVGGPAPRRERARVADRPSDGVRHSVLVAEDDPTNQQLTRLLLEHLGHRVDIVGNGAEALAAVRWGRYDAVLLDVQMPDQDGLEVARQVRRELPLSRQPYLIALTASALREDRERCLRAGMDDYLSKPVDLEVLEQALARAWVGRPATPPAAAPARAADDAGLLERDIGEADGGALLQREVGAADDAGLLRPQVGAAPPHAPIDPQVWQKTLDALGPNAHALLSAVIGEYLEDAPTLLTSMRAAAAGRDRESLLRAAHRLRSSSFLVAATQLARLCDELEDRARAGMLDGAQEQVRAIEAEFARVRGALRL